MGRGVSDRVFQITSLYRLLELCYFKELILPGQLFDTVDLSVGDPDLQDPHVYGPPGS
jgi:hypothetical protein